VVGLEHQVQKAAPEVECPHCGGPAKVVLHWMESGLPFSVECLTGGHGRIMGLPGEDEEMLQVCANLTLGGNPKYEALAASIEEEMRMRASTREEGWEDGT
jgi:hypothetical protein